MALAASSSAAARLPAAPSGLAQVPLSVAGRGHAHRFVVEVAASPADQERGLMFRKSIAPDRGMIFPFPHPQQATFWMKNTLIPLDIIFIRADGRIANVAADAVPQSLAIVPSEGPVLTVLEIAGGRAAQLGIHAGDKVTWKR